MTVQPTTETLFLDRPEWCLDCGERTKASQENCPECGTLLYQGTPVKVYVNGPVNLPNGDRAFVGKGGTYIINGDTYPITILGWSKSGRVVYYRKANHRGAAVFVDNENAPIEVATYRNKCGSFKPKGRGYGFVRCDGYDHQMDPSF